MRELMLICWLASIVAASYDLMLNLTMVSRMLCNIWG
jgi:hypothetical protein